MNDNIKGKIPMFIIILILVVLQSYLLLMKPVYLMTKTHTFDEAVENK